MAPPELVDDVELVAEEVVLIELASVVDPAVLLEGPLDEVPAVVAVKLVEEVEIVVVVVAEPVLDVTVLGHVVVGANPTLAFTLSNAT